MTSLVDQAYVEQLINALDRPLEFHTFEGILRTHISELYQRSLKDVKGLSCDVSVKSNLLVLLRSHIYSALAHGHLVDNNYINLWFLYAQQSIEEDPSITRLITLFDATYEGYTNQQKEKYTFVHLLCVLKMINGEGAQSIGWFLGEHLWFDGICYNQMDQEAKALQGFCEQCQISLSMIAPFLANALNHDRFIHARFSERMGLSTWILGFFWKIKGYENDSSWVETIYPKLHELFLTCKENGWIDEMMSLHLVMSHLVLNRAQTQNDFKMFNIDVEYPASEFYTSWAKKHQLELTENSLHVKKKIALIKDRIVENSPYKVEFSLLSALSQDKGFQENYELIVYSMALVEKSLDDPRCIKAIQNLGFEVSTTAFEHLDLSKNYQSSLIRALVIREDMQRREIDMMIMVNNNNPIANFLFCTRSAPTQIFWSHGNFEYDVQGIDTKMSHCLAPKEKEMEYGIFSVPQLIQFNHVSHKKEMIKKERLKYPHDKIILGMIGRLVKMDNDAYLQAVAAIMYANPRTIFLACGTGDMEALKSKIKALDLSGRFFFPGFVDPHLYGAVIDIWLDTFPLPGGQSVLEYMSKGKPLLYLVDLNRLDTVQKKAHQKTVAEGVARFFAVDVEDYKTLANRMIQEAMYRKEVEKCVQKAYAEWSHFDLSLFDKLLLKAQNIC